MNKPRNTPRKPVKTASPRARTEEPTPYADREGAKTGRILINAPLTDVNALRTSYAPRFYARESIDVRRDPVGIAAANSVTEPSIRVFRLIGDRPADTKEQLTAVDIATVPPWFDIPQDAILASGNNATEYQRSPRLLINAPLQLTSKAEAGVHRISTASPSLTSNFVIKPPRKLPRYGPATHFRQKKIAALVAKLLERRMERLLEKVAEAKPAPFASAKARGIAMMKAELEKSENLSLKEASEYSGRSDRLINEARQRGDLYALVQEGNSRGFRYPAWQFDVDSARLAPVLIKLAAYPLSCWTKHNFLLKSSDLLNGLAPRDLIADPVADIERVLRAIRQRFSGEQGAL